MSTRISPDAAHKSWWQIFEVVFGVPYLTGIVLQRAVPVSFPDGRFASVIVAGGAALIVTGIIFIFLARRQLAQQGQPSDPGLPTEQLVTTGVFSVSRNPLYLGGTCFLAGIALAFGLPWALFSLVPALVACHYILIRPEERYLAARFGMGYAQYAASVHRWLGRVRDG
jgi:protein-S-isoprenylcysteine O-methyltransferase Ste14